MAVSDWQQAFWASTRGQVFDHVRRAPRTVEELAALVGLTDNAVRAHLQTLERDGLVRPAGARRGASPGKPARLYEVEPAADERFSRAYAPMLQALVATLAERGAPAEMAALLRLAGQKLGRLLARSASGQREQALAAAAILTELGGAVELEERGSTHALRGCGCPLGTVTAVQPAVCGAVEALLAEATGARVRERCVRDGRARCQFEIGPQKGHRSEAGPDPLP